MGLRIGRRIGEEVGYSQARYSIHRRRPLDGPQAYPSDFAYVMFRELRPMRGPGQTRPTIAQRGTQRGLRPYVGLSIAKFISLPPRATGSVYSCSQYVTRPPLWHTKRTPPSWEITTATDPGSAPASR